MRLFIRELEVVNFLGHRHERIEFDENGGIVLFWGPSGAGKSTFIDAIGFALFGLHATRAKSLHELVHESYVDEDWGVRLTMQMVGRDHEVQVYRGVERGRSVVWILDSDHALVEGNREVAKRVKAMLGDMDAATFHSTYFSQQGEMDSLVRMAGADRRKFIQRLYGVEMLDKVTRRINRELVAAKSRVQTLNDQMPEESRDALTAQMEHATRHVNDLSDQQTSLQTELDGITAAGMSLKTTLQSLEQKAQRHYQLMPMIETAKTSSIPADRTRISELEAKLDEAAQAAARLKDASDAEGEVQALNDEAKTLAAAEGAIAALRQSEADVQSAQQIVKDLQASRSAVEPLDVPEPLEACADAISTIESELSVIHSRIADTKQSISDLDGNGECYTCRRPLTDPEEVLGNLRATLNDLERQAEQGDAERSRLLQRRQQIDRAHVAYREYTERLRRLDHDIQSATDRHVTLAARLEELRGSASNANASRLSAVRERLQQLAEVSAQINHDRSVVSAGEAAKLQLADSKRGLAERETTLQAQEREIQDLNHDETHLKSVREDHEQTRVDYQRVRDRISETKQQRTLAEAQRTENANALKRLDALETQRDLARTRHSHLERLNDAMKAFRTHLIGQIRPALETATSQHLSALTSGRMAGVVIDEDYNLSVKFDDGTVRRIGLCSGGEQARAAFAMRISLTQLVSARTDTPVGFIAFDEIFGSQDDEHRRAILESLRYLRSIYPQTLLISHESSLQHNDLIDTMVFVPGGDGEDQVRVVEN